MDVKVTILLTQNSWCSFCSYVSRLEIQFKLVTAMMVDYFFNEMASDGGLLF